MADDDTDSSDTPISVPTTKSETRTIDPEIRTPEEVPDEELRPYAEKIYEELVEGRQQREEMLTKLESWPRRAWIQTIIGALLGSLVGFII